MHHFSGINVCHKDEQGICHKAPGNAIDWLLAG